MLVDSHCHLDSKDFEGELDEIVARARCAGVGLMLTIGMGAARRSRVIEIVERHPGVYATLGIHPHEAASEPEIAPADFAALARHPKIVGIGECGLDYYYDKAPREVQRRRFREQIAAARLAGLPFVVHSRDADEDMGAILEEAAGEGAPAAVMHCFSSGARLAERALALGHYISLSGMITFKKADELREIARAVPLDRLLVETDAPFLAPIPHRGKRNEPAYVALTAAALAELRGVTVAELAARTTENFLRLFDRVPRPAPAERAESRA